MAQERFDTPAKDVNDYDEDYENDGLDDYSDDYDDDDRYQYSGSMAHDREGRRGNSFSGSGHSNEMNEDSRKDHHNQLERKRRASIKSSYTELREAIPSLRDNKASRSVILQKAVDYLEELNRRNIDHVACVDHFTSENSALEAKCREIENQVQMLLRQQRQSGQTTVHGGSSGPHYHHITAPARSSVRPRDEEDSNDMASSSTSTTPTASASIASSISASAPTAPGDPCLDISEPEKVGQPVESGSNSSSLDYYDDIEEAVAPKKPRTE